MSPRYCFEDFETGSTMTYGPAPVSRDDIVGFAREYDPQAFHLDEEAAKATFVGTLIASGWQTCGFLMRSLARDVLLDSSCMGAPGIEEVKWLRPVRPGDVLRGSHEVLETRASRSRPEMGLVRFRFTLRNQADEPVLAQTNWIMFGRRGAAAPAPATPPPPAPAIAEAPPAAEPAPLFDDLAVGATSHLGSHLFTAEEIVRFALQWDPQLFHVDADAAARSHFGALCASGWHTAAVWMKQMIAHRERSRAAARAAGTEPARLGPSPGFRDMKWLRPVYAGDVITYTSTVVDTRPSASRPQWGLVSHHNTGVNQRGERVFEFQGTVFWERKTG